MLIKKGVFGLVSPILKLLCIIRASEDHSGEKVKEKYKFLF